MIYDDQRVELVRDNHLTTITTRVKQEYDQAEILIRYDDSKFCYTYYYSMIMQELSSSKVNVIYTLRKSWHCGALCRCVQCDDSMSNTVHPFYHSHSVEQ